MYWLILHTRLSSIFFYKLSARRSRLTVSRNSRVPPLSGQRAGKAGPKTQVQTPPDSQCPICRLFYVKFQEKNIWAIPNKPNLIHSRMVTTRQWHSPLSFNFLEIYCNRISFDKGIKTLNIEYVNKFFFSFARITFSSNFLRTDDK